MKYAPLYKRIIATYIDSFIFSIILIIGLMLDIYFETSYLTNIFEFTFVIMSIYFLSKYGKTLGKLCLKIKVLNNDYTQLTKLKSSLRYLSYMIYLIPFAYLYSYLYIYITLNYVPNDTFLNIFPLLISLIYILIISIPFYYLRNDKKLLHDVITKTIVVNDEILNKD